MARPRPRHTYERRLRLRRAIRRRRLQQARRYGLVAVSVAVFALSVSAAFAVVRTFDAADRIEPLFVVDGSADAPSRVGLNRDTQPRRTAATGSSSASPSPAAVTAFADELSDRPTPASAPVRQTVVDADAEVRQFNGRPVKAVRRIRMLVTAYSPDERSCGKFADGVTASGYSVWANGGKLVAADTRILPFGSLVEVPGYHNDGIVPVLDRGGKIKGHRLDLLFPTHEQAREWGKKWLTVTVYEFVE
jgi:3D (Asp-Asp-Asp) domain-containing protein